MENKESEDIFEQEKSLEKIHVAEKWVCERKNWWIWVGRDYRKGISSKVIMVVLVWTAVVGE